KQDDPVVGQGGRMDLRGGRPAGARRPEAHPPPPGARRGRPQRKDPAEDSPGPERFAASPPPASPPLFPCRVPAVSPPLFPPPRGRTPTPGGRPAAAPRPRRYGTRGAAVVRAAAPSTLRTPFTNRAVAFPGP